MSPPMLPWFLFLLQIPDVDGDPVLPPPPPAVNARTNDVFFTYAVEDFVASARTVRHFEGVLPPDLLSAVRCMDCDRFACRELATDVVRRHPDGVRAACWGVRAANGEIRARCTRLLREAVRCPHCDGSGCCPAKCREDEVAWFYNPSGYCTDCTRNRFRDGIDMIDVPWGHPVRGLWDMRCRNCDGRGDVLFLLELPGVRE